jgi:hypothetical protein
MHHQSNARAVALLHGIAELCQPGFGKLPEGLK